MRRVRLPRGVLAGRRDNGRSERHGRALLRLPDPNAQRMALAVMAESGMTVAAAEAYVDALLKGGEGAEEEKPGGRRTMILKDVRIFLNSLNRSLDLMKQGGIDAGIRREETEDSLILTISIPKSRAAEHASPHT